MDSKSFAQKIYDESIKAGTDPIKDLMDALDIIYMKYNRLISNLSKQLDIEQNKK